MAKKRTEKSRYESKYSPKGYVTAAQYICELICVAKARKENKELPLKFWELKEWRNYFVFQSKYANKLLKEYDERAIIAVLKNPKNAKTFSLAANWLIPQFEEEHQKILVKDQQLKELAEKKDVFVDVKVGNNERPSMKNTRFGGLD